MTANTTAARYHPLAPSEPRSVDGWATWGFVCLVFAIGAVVLARAAATLYQHPIDVYVVLLAVLIVASGCFKIKVPGQPATVSVSEVFVFVSVVLFGPAPAALTVAFDGLWISLIQRHRRFHRALFNIAEPAISTWIAGSVFFAAAGAPPLGLSHPAQTALLLPTVAMAATYFLLNSSLTAVAVALENGGSAFELWSRHALYLGVNYYAAASLATLAVNSPSGINLGTIGLVAPLLILSYVAYKTAASRIEDADRHLREVKHLYQATVETLAIAVDAKDQVTHGHIRRVQRHTLAMARRLGVTDETELKALEAASLLHDVGKLAVPDHVLNKPGALSNAEFDQMKLHANKGAEILMAVEFPYPVVPIVRHHHEQWNGCGYPDGLSGTAIPLGARILSVVDCFDALTSDRPYRRKLGDAEATKILRACSGVTYDPAVVEAFIELIPELRRDDVAMGQSSSSEMLSSVVEGRLLGPAARRADLPPDDALSTLAALSLIGPTLEAKLAQLMPAAEFSLFAPDAAGEALVAAHATTLIRDVVQSLHLRIGEGLSGWVAANRHTIVNSRPDLDFGDAALEIGLRSCTSTPVFALGNIVGVLTVYSACRQFSDREVRLIGALAQEVGMEIARYSTGFVSEGDRVHVDGRGAAAVC